MDILKQIELKLPNMSKGHKLLANYILQNYDKASYMTAVKLSNAIGISESTVVRFAYSLGYNGYPAFQKALKQLVQSKLTSIQRLKIAHNEMNETDVLDVILKSDMNNIKSTLEQMDKQVFNQIINALLTSKKIYIIGSRSCASLSSFLVHYLTYLLPESVCAMSSFGDPLEYLIRIKKEDCLVAISFPRYSRATVEAMGYAKECGATTVATTDNENSPLVSVASYSLYAKSHNSSLADSLVAPLSVINAIVSAVGLQRKEQASEYFSKLEEVWGNRNIYSQKEIINNE